MTMYVHKAKRSPPSADYLILENHPFYTPPHLSSATLPESLDLSSNLQVPRDQGSRGTCVAFATCVIKEYQANRDINLVSYQSPEFIYWFRSDKTGSDSEGMTGFDAMQALQTVGSVPEFKLPYESSDPNPDIPQTTITSLYPFSSNFRIQSYALVTTIAGVQSALNQYGPCLILMPVYSTRPEFWRQASATDPLQGGHGVAIVGYNSTGFIIRNSWGSSWNSNGTVIFPYTDFGCQWEIWSTLDLTATPINYVIPPDSTTISSCIDSLKNCKCILL